MTTTLIIIALFILNIILIIKLGPYKAHIASGIELTLTGGFLAGYWFGYLTGIMVSVVFMLSSYIASMSFSPSMLITVPGSVILGIIGAYCASLSIDITSIAIMGVILYCIITDLIILKVFGHEYFFDCVISDMGAVFINTFVFILFF